MEKRRKSELRFRGFSRDVNETCVLLGC